MKKIRRPTAAVPRRMALATLRPETPENRALAMIQLVGENMNRTTPRAILDHQAREGCSTCAHLDHGRLRCVWFGADRLRAWAVPNKENTLEFHYAALVNEEDARTASLRIIGRAQPPPPRVSVFLATIRRVQRREDGMEVVRASLACRDGSCAIDMFDLHAATGRVTWHHAFALFAPPEHAKEAVAVVAPRAIRPAPFSGDSEYALRPARHAPPMSKSAFS